jgi:hypothetical protein
MALLIRLFVLDLYFLIAFVNGFCVKVKFGPQFKLPSLLKGVGALGAMTKEF